MRTEQERAERHRLILATAREIAEQDGWDAVTTRRLAEQVGYSQPVLYGHFAGKEAIVAAVAVEGFAELATALERAADPAAVVGAEVGPPNVDGLGGAGAGVGAAVGAPDVDGLAGAAAGVGAAVGTPDVDGLGGAAGRVGVEVGGAGGRRACVRRLAVAYLLFAREHPALYAAMFVRPLNVAFAADDTPPELHRAFAQVRRATATEAGAEVLWATLHGLATLTASGRLPPENETQRLEALIASVPA